MNRLRGAVLAAGVLMTLGPAPARGQGPKAEGTPRWARETEDSIKPLPLESIPDSPPPHEGNFFPIAHRIEPTDLILVEVLEAYPGRPITGERLVRPDGKISLHWYGELSVAGLTSDQVREKVVLHLRNYLTDQSLGLIAWREGGMARDRKTPRPPDALPRSPLPAEEDFEAVPLPFLPEGAAPGGPVPPAGTVPSTKVEQNPVGEAPARTPRRPRRGSGPLNTVRPLRVPVAGMPPLPAGAVPGPPAGPPVVAGGGEYVYVEAKDSDRVFVDVSAYNSKVYYVGGDVGVPGRLPYTGLDTVLDALKYSGGLLPMADRRNIRLHRPARGEKPQRSYRIDLDAIEQGEKKANLQLFPGDRLLIGRVGDPKPPVQ